MSPALPLRLLPSLLEALAPLLFFVLLIAGGGLGQLAIQYGLYRFESTTMYISSLLLIILVQIMQETLNYIAKVCDKRIRNK